MIKWMVTLVQKALPDFILRWAWPPEKLLQAIEVFHFNQAPCFYIRAERVLHELQYTGFNVFNLSPFKLTIVGADIQIVVDSTDWLKHLERMPSEISVQPFSRSGFHIAPPLRDSVVKRLREYPHDWMRIRVRGTMILKTTYGELRKELHADVVATIDRDPTPSRPRT